MREPHDGPPVTHDDAIVSDDPDGGLKSARSKTPSGRTKAKGSTDPFTSRLSDEFFDELRAKRGFGQRLTALRSVSINAPDPIIEEALRALQEEFGKGASKKEERLAALYLTEVEQVTARLNARQLPRTTRLLLSQRGVYVNLLTSVIGKMVQQSNGHTHASEAPAPATAPSPEPRRTTKSGRVVSDPTLPTE